MSGPDWNLYPEHPYLFSEPERQQGKIFATLDKELVDRHLPEKALSCFSLVKPSNPDATYDGHNGQGYQVQIRETYCDREEYEVIREDPQPDYP